MMYRFQMRIDGMGWDGIGWQLHYIAAYGVQYRNGFFNYTRYTCTFSMETVPRRRWVILYTGQEEPQLCIIMVMWCC